MGIGLRWITPLALVALASIFNALSAWEAHQKINSLETRVEAIEERAGSCEVVPIP